MIGIDIIQISRMERLMQRFKNKALQRFLHEEEILHVKSAQSAAGLWAAKEAASKALGCGIGETLSFLDMKIIKTPAGAPQIFFSRKIVEKFALEDAHLSITHDGGFAIAVVVLETKKITQKTMEGF
jgi:holo-[acyl-carrier protein] synthase